MLKNPYDFVIWPEKKLNYIDSVIYRQNIYRNFIFLLSVSTWYFLYDDILI